MRLIDTATGEEIRTGAIVRDVPSGARATVVYFRPPHKPASSGKVTVRWEDGGTGEYYVGVFGLGWIGREDQA